MNITWIIGNGFDKNLGLNTGYKYFIDKIYLPKDKDHYPPYKQQLVDAVQRLKGWNSEGDKWSDLEQLLGAVTQEYDVHDQEAFETAFDEMLGQMLEHLRGEESRADELFNSEIVANEVWDSIVNLRGRLASVDYEVARSYQDVHENIIYNFITLNYTHTMDTLASSIISAHNPFNRRYFADHTYNDTVSGDILHLHGTLDANGAPIFGVSDASQIANTDFANSESIVGTWTKRSRNLLYGNRRTEQAEAIIGRSDLIIVYGCSLGPTDAYIWETIVKRMMEDSSVSVILFDYDMPSRTGYAAHKYRDARDQLAGKLLYYVDMDEAQDVELRGRIVCEQSGIVFRFKEASGEMADVD